MELLRGNPHLTAKPELAAVGKARGRIDIYRRAVDKGGKGFLKSFMEPIPIMLPMNILEVFIRPLSLCMRLFGNILGAFVIMELVKIVAPLLVPIPLSLYFDLFDGFIQAYVFVFLTSLFIKESIE